MKEEKKSMEKKIKDLAYVFAGSVLVALGITSILKPNGLITGGITGTSLVLEKAIGIQYTYIYYFLSIIVLVSTYVFLGKKEGRKIIVFSLFFPLILIFFNKYQFNLVENDLFLASVFYGILAGGGTGLILKGGFSSGGTDTIAKIINRRLFRFMSISIIIASLDVIIIGFAAIIFDSRIALYALITQVVVMKAMEIVLYGFTSKVVKLEIISEKESEIEEYILKTLNRGISKYNIVGGYTSLTRVKLITICSMRESFLVRDAVSKIDSKAFVTVLPVHSVWGEGVGFDRLIMED